MKKKKNFLNAASVWCSYVDAFDRISEASSIMGGFAFSGICLDNLEDKKPVRGAADYYR